MMRRAQYCVLLAVACLSAGVGRPQVAGSFRAALPPPYTPQVWDIDWSYLAQPGAVTDWTDTFHYIPAGPRPGHYLAVTGQVRERGEYQDHPAFGSQPADNGYFQQRYLLSGDLHLGPHVRTFVQLESGLEEGRDGGPRPGIDQDKLDFN